jgi:hypothetical protein
MATVIETRDETVVEERPHKTRAGSGYWVVLLMLLGAIGFYLFFAIPEFTGILGL